MHILVMENIMLRIRWMCQISNLRIHEPAFIRLLLPQNFHKESLVSFLHTTNTWVAARGQTSVSVPAMGAMQECVYPSISVPSAVN
jgi:hypothetical protein